MAYPPEDGHPSRYEPSPTCFNLVHATNAANHYAMPPNRDIRNVALASSSSSSSCYLRSHEHDDDVAVS